LFIGPAKKQGSNAAKNNVYKTKRQILALVGDKAQIVPVNSK
jgi:hypothetical protein